MKRVFKIFLILFTVFIMVGCNKMTKSSNFMDANYKEVKNNADVIYNFNESIKRLDGLKFDGVVTVKDKNYEFNGKVILGETIEKSIINLNYKDNNLYVKNGEVYIGYRYNNTNVIIKDSLDNIIEEIADSLQNKGIKCDREIVYDIIKNKTKNDVNLIAFNEYLSEIKDRFNFNYKGYNISLNKHFLPETIIYDNKDFKINLNISYEDVSIKIPLGYNLLNIDIEDIKELLNVNYISDLIK